MKAPKMTNIPDKKKSSYSEIENGKYFNPQPTLQIGEDILPEVKDWKVDSTYNLTIQVKMTGLNTDEYGPQKGKTNGSFRITKIGVNK